MKEQNTYETGIKDHHFYLPWEIIQERLLAKKIEIDELAIKTFGTFRCLAKDYSEFENMASKHEYTKGCKDHFETIYEVIENYKRNRK